MQRILFLIFAIISWQSVSAQSIIVDNDRKFLTFIVKRDYETAERLLAYGLKSKIKEIRLGGLFSKVTSQLGPILSFDTTAIQKDMHTFMFAVNFGDKMLNMQISSNDSAKITGFYLLPIKVSYHPPEYADTSKIKEQNIKIGIKNTLLPAVLTTPKITSNHSYPLVIFLGGSGPEDMDESIGAIKPFKDLAMGLAQAGIATLRFDKRQVIYPQTFVSKCYTIKDEYLEDAKSAVTYAREIPEVDHSKIFILGHSMGGMLSPMILKDNPVLKGAVMLEGNSRPLEDLYYEQSVHLSKSQAPQNDISLIRLKNTVLQIKNIRSKDSTETYLGLKGSYWLSLRGYNPAEVARKLNHQNMLIIQGGHDYQVDESNYKIWKTYLGRKPNITLLYEPDLNHAIVNSKGTFLPGEYNTPSNVPINLINKISAWIFKGQLPN